MADFDSSLPIRTEGAGDVIVKIADATITSQQLAVEADGSINVNAVFAPGGAFEITDGTDTLEINADGSLNAVVTATDLDIRDLAFATDSVDVSGSSVTVSATDLDIRDLAFATDKVDASGSTLGANSGVDIGDVTINNAAGAAAVNIQDGGNSITVDGSVTVSATDLDIRDLAFATDSVDVSGSSVTATVSATDLDIRNLSASQDNVAISDGTDSLAINADGSINVQITKRNGSLAVSDFNTATNIASAASSTHTYTSTGNFYLEQVEASASGKMKIEIQVNSVAKCVMFNSSANPNMSLRLEQPILATSGQTVTVIRTNLDNQAQNLYSTVVGYNA